MLNTSFNDFKLTERISNELKISKNSLCFLSIQKYFRIKFFFMNGSLKMKNNINNVHSLKNIKPKKCIINFKLFLIYVFFLRSRCNYRKIKLIYFQQSCSCGLDIILVLGKKLNLKKSILHQTVVICTRLFNTKTLIEMISTLNSCCITNSIFI